MPNGLGLQQKKRLAIFKRLEKRKSISFLQETSLYLKGSKDLARLMERENEF